MSDLFVDNIKHQSSQGSGTITIGASGEAVDLGGTTGGTLTARPSFEAYISSQADVPDQTNTLAKFALERHDVGGCYNNTGSSTTLNGLTAPAYSFTPNVAGYYCIYLNLGLNAESDATLYASDALIYLNGSEIRRSHMNMGNNYTHYTNNYVSCVIELNGTGDYVQAYGQINDTNNHNVRFQQGTYSQFGAYRLVGI